MKSHELTEEMWGFGLSKEDVDRKVRAWLAAKAMTYNFLEGGEILKHHLGLKLPDTKKECKHEYAKHEQCIWCRAWKEREYDPRVVLGARLRKFYDEVKYGRDRDELFYETLAEDAINWMRREK